MSIASEILNYANGLGDAYDAVNDMGGTIPQDKNMNNLDTSIRTIPQNLGPTYTAGNGIVIDANDEISIDDTVVAELSDLPTKTSELINDGSDNTSTYVEADELATVATSGDYDDLLNKPTIPTVNDATLTITQNGTSAGTFTANSSTDTTIALTDTTYSDYTGATSLTDGTAGLVPKPLAGDETKFLSGNGQWTTVSQYSLPIASANDLGGIKVGSNLSIDAGTGVLSATVPTVNDATLTITQNGTSAGTFTANSSSDTTIALTDTTYSDFGGATSSVAGSAGLVPAPTTSDPDKFLKGDGTWDTPTDTTYSAGTNVQISAGNVISATDTTYSDFTGATSSVAGANGLVPAPAAGDEGKALHGDGTWKDATAKLVEMSYGESNAWAKFIAAYNAGSIVYCRASSNANPGTGSQTRKAFMAYVNNATTPTSVEFQYVRSVSSKSSSQPVDQVFVYTLTNSNGGTWSVATRDMAPKLVAGTNTSVSYSSGTYTVSATDTTYSDMTGATSGTAGAAGLVPAPAAGDQDKVLSGAGTWVAQPAAQVQSDWDQSDNTAADYIKNKPTIPVVPTVDANLSISSTNPVQNKAITRFADKLYAVGNTVLSTTGTDLNTITYLKVGVYQANTYAIASTFLNCPTRTAFVMSVSAPWDETIDNESTGIWIRRRRVLTDLEGHTWEQFCNVGATAGVWTYGSWKKVSESVITMTSTDPGAGSALAADNYVAVYGSSDGIVTASDIDMSTISRIMIQGTAGDTTYSTNTEIALSSTTAQLGTGLTRSGNKVLVGSGVSYVRVSANVFMNYTSMSYGWFDIMKNSAAYSNCTAIVNLVSSGYCSASVGGILMPVTSGDTIWLRNKDACKIRGYNSWLTVEQVA